VSLAVKLGGMGTLAKRADIELDTLMIRLSASGEEQVIDKIPIGGNCRQVVTRTFSNLASFKIWTATAVTKDTAGKAIHSGSIDFEVQPNGQTDVTLDLAARYTMLKAKIFPRRDGVESCVLFVDESLIADASFGLADTVKLSFDYLTAHPQGTLHTIRMEAQGGGQSGRNTLYRGDTVISVISGENASYHVTLRCLFPNPPPGAATMTVVLGAIGGVRVDGEMEGIKVPAELYVDSSAPAGGNGLSWGTAFNDLQKAIGKAEIFVNANPGTSVGILIAKGTYFPSETGDTSESFRLRTSVSLIGGYPAGGGPRDTFLNMTILSGASGGRIIQALNVDSTAVLDGFTISGGSADHGAAFSCINSSPTLINCKFIGNRNFATGTVGAVFDSSSSPRFIECAFIQNRGDRGAAICNVHSSPVIVNCYFGNNKGSRFLGDGFGGGGICNVSSSPRILGCIFVDNTSCIGGAIINYSLSSPTITGCIFRENNAIEYHGGAIANSNSDPFISQCVFEGNSAWDGGGGAIHNSWASPVILNCTFLGNINHNFYNEIGGGAIANLNSSNPIITNCTFVANGSSGGQGGALFDSASFSLVTNCTFTRNSAQFDGAYHGTSGILTNCIFWGDSAADPENSGALLPFELSAGIPTVKNCIISGGYTGGMAIIDQNPILGPLADNGDLVPTCAIPFDSPAKDAGTITVPTGVDISKDGRGMPRSDSKPDLGAYEVQ
jgi:hypothetical protein